jgi:spore coat protein CotH
MELGAFAPWPPAATPQLGPNRSLPPPTPGANFFSHSSIHKFKISLTAESLASLRKEPRRYVTGQVTVDGTAYADVAIHLKGEAGRFRGVEAKPSLTLNFHREHPGQNLDGLQKIHLNNSVQDPSSLQLLQVEQGSLVE